MILIILTNILFVDSATYQLNYEGIVSPHNVLKHAEISHKRNPDDINLNLLPPTIAEETIVTIGSNLFNIWTKNNISEKDNGFSSQWLPIDFTCFPGGPKTCRPQSTIASEYIERDRFLERLTSSTDIENGIAYEAAFVYDEETSFPLDSTFIISFIEYGSEPYERFTRDSVAIIDLDMVDLRWQSKAQLFTKPRSIF